MSDKFGNVDHNIPGNTVGYKPTLEEAPEYYRGKKVEIRHKDNWTNIKDQYMISPILGGEGRVIIQEDPHKDKFECQKCHGKGHLGEVCQYCLGTRFERGKEENGYCRDCTVGEAGMGRTLGYVACPECKGQGGIIVLPDESKRNTTTGDVLAISKDGIRQVKVGDKVMFTNYTGSPFKFLDIDLRVAVEKDLLALVKQLKSNVEGLNEGSYAELTNTGTPHE